MEALKNATEVRKDWGHFIDTVVRVRPQFVRRNRDSLVAISTDHLKLLLSSCRFQLEVEEEEDGSVSGSLADFDLVANAETTEELKKALAEDLIEYAQEYEEEYALYSTAPNRKYHAPFIMNVLLQDDVEGVVSLIDA